MKPFYLLLMVVLLIQVVSGSIEITEQLEDEYNLGEDIDFSVKIIPTASKNALLKLTLRCTKKEIVYYTTPIYLEQSKETNIKAPSIKAFSEGLCNIKANVNSLEAEEIEDITSKDFSISDRLELSFSVDKTEALPGDEIKIEGSATKKGESIEKGSVLIILGDKKEEKDLDGSEFSYGLELDENIKSGEHTVTVEVKDPYGNFNEKGKVINVKAVPTNLEFELNGKEFNPGESLKLTVRLLDQADDIIQENVDAKLFKKKGLLWEEIILFNVQAEVNKEIDFTFDSSATPEDYILRVSFDDLEKEEIITILPYPKIEIRLEGNIVFVRNVGNVKYNDKTTILLEADSKTYLINKKIKLDIGEETAIDLSKEVPSGNYKVTLPAENARGEGEAAINVIENVEIEDNRPFYKRGLRGVTGWIVAGAGLLLARPRAASWVIIIIILSLIGYFNRGRIGRIIEKVREKRNEKF